MDSEKNKENIYCIFNQTSPDTQIEKAFAIYLKELTKTKDNNIEKSTKKD